MKAKEFFFDLPEHLIAQEPTPHRGQSRLMVLNKTTGKVTHSHVKDIAQFVPENAVMVFNDSRVRKARIYGKTEFGGKVEFLLLKNLGQGKWKTMVSKAKKQVVGKVYQFPEEVSAQILELDGQYRVIQFSKEIEEDYLETYGHIPLPPYIKREDKKSDEDRYQNIYSKTVGSVAAPTAGLHFTDEILESLKKKGVSIEFVTLHVGLGTFSPIRSENIDDHQMHYEEFLLTEKTANALVAAKKEGRPIIAVGTTSVRTLESAFRNGEPEIGWQSTNLFIKPGYSFNIVDRLFTNFHTPDSTLIILVSAFAGMENIKGAYQQALEEEYRFFSYGDAMFITE